MSLQVWILTFNRPVALNRLIQNLNNEGFIPNIFNNHPSISINSDLKVGKIVNNNLSFSDSNSWCSRSWNSILLHNFESYNSDSIVLIQDDTDIGKGFGSWLMHNSQFYDVIWGPAGDQFIYMTREIIQKTGWFDERYQGCYVQDCDYLRRIWETKHDISRLSIQDSHDWGFIHNPIEINRFVITTYQSKTCDPLYDNQHWTLERLAGGHNTSEVNPLIVQSQENFLKKWGIPLTAAMPIINNINRRTEEIDWYYWASKKYKIGKYA